MEQLVCERCRQNSSHPVCIKFSMEGGSESRWLVCATCGAFLYMKVVGLMEEKNG